MPSRHGARHRCETGQTAAEYLGLILLIVAIIATIAASGIAGTVSARLQCAISQSSCDNTSRSRAESTPDTAHSGGNGSSLRTPRGSGGAAESAASPPRRASTPGTGPKPPNAEDPAPGTLVSDLEGVGGYPNRHGGAEVRPAFVKKIICKAPGFKQICKWTVGRLEDEITKACQKAVNTCKRLVDKVCKIGGKLCDIARKASCLALGVLCKKPKAKPKIPGSKPPPLRYPAAGSKVERVRGRGGTVRFYDVDKRGRATAVRARLNPRAINQGTAAGKRTPKGFRKGKDDRTHLLARELGGRGIRRNIILASRRFNQRVMRVPERIARRELERGNSIIYEAIPYYRRGQRRPVAVRVRITREADGNVLYDRRLTGTR